MLANQVSAADWVTGVSQSVADDIVGYASSVASRLSVISNGVVPPGGPGLPMVALEAAWAGRPVVGSRSTGTIDAVVDGETGCLVEPGDVDALTKQLGDLIADPARARALGAAARARGAGVLA